MAWEHKSQEDDSGLERIYPVLGNTHLICSLSFHVWRLTTVPGSPSLVVIAALSKSFI